MVGGGAGERPEVVVRQAAPADADGIAACLAVAFEPYRDDYTPDGFDDTVLTEATARERMRTMTILVAVDDAGDVAGTVGYEVSPSGEGHLRGMAVTPVLQGQGIADRLLAAAEEGARQHGARHMTLDTTEPLRRATRFYRRHGYRPTGVERDFFGMPLHEYAKSLEP